MIKGLLGLFLFFLPFLVHELREEKGTHFGSIAISMETLQFGTSDHHPSRKKADKAAIAVCREGAEKPEDCKTAVWFHDACGALAVEQHADGKKDGAWGANWAGTEKVAKEKAIEICMQHSRRNECKIVKTVCSM